MKTRCPDCQTVFRVTPEQLKARAGKVRCGHCQTVFNALDSLLETQHPAAPVLISNTPEEHVPAIAVEESELPDSPQETAPSLPADEPEIRDLAVDETPSVTEASLDPAATQEIGKAAGLILPRETSEIPGYSKWAEGVMAAPVSLPEETRSHWPFSVVAVLLALIFAGQAVFHFRSELAVSAPSLRPALEAISLALDSPLPLPMHSELVGIETSDLQTDPTRGHLLVLNATLRNRAPYGQAYPSLELSLTDTQDVAIARRVFAPGDYLPAKTPAGQPFPGNSDLAIRLWIEARDISAAGYRLFIFYP